MTADQPRAGVLHDAREPRRLRAGRLHRGQARRSPAAPRRLTAPHRSVARRSRDACAVHERPKCTSCETRCGMQNDINVITAAVDIDLISASRRQRVTANRRSRTWQEVPHAVHHHRASRSAQSRSNPSRTGTTTRTASASTPICSSPSAAHPPARPRRCAAAAWCASDCLEFALQNGEKFGIWGGLSERERRRIRRQRAQVARSIIGA